MSLNPDIQKTDEMKYDLLFKEYSNVSNVLSSKFKYNICLYQIDRIIFITFELIKVRRYVHFRKIR